MEFFDTTAIEESASWTDYLNLSTLNGLDIAITLLVCIVLGLLISFVYKQTFRGPVYNRNFNISLIILTVITGITIKAITANIILSLGMVGALSIVRFRTAIKEPMDLTFMFWSIAMGIISGAGLYILAAAGSVIITVLMVVLYYSGKAPTESYILMLQGEYQLSNENIAIFCKSIGVKACLKSSTANPNGKSLVYDITIKKGVTPPDFMEIQGVTDFSLVDLREGTKVI